MNELAQLKALGAHMLVNGNGEAYPYVIIMPKNTIPIPPSRRNQNFYGYGETFDSALADLNRKLAFAKSAAA